MKKIYLSFLTLIGAFSLSAQDDFYMQSGSSVTVQGGGLLYVRGAVKGEGNATLDNAGTIWINTANTSILPITGRGELEWNSSSPINNTNGSIILKGTGDARVFGSGASTVTTGTLDINVARITGPLNDAIVEIDRNITTSNLKLQSGLVKVSGSNELYVKNNSATAITDSSVSGFKWGDKGSSYVIGKLKRDVIASRIYQFPIGSEDKGYNLAEITTKSGFPSTTITSSFQDHGSVAGTTKPNFSIYQELLNPGCPGGGTWNQWLELDRIVNDFGQWNMTSSASGIDIYDFKGYPNLSAISDLSSYVFLKIIKAPENTPFSTDWSTFVASSGDKCAGVNVYNGEIFPIGQAPNGSSTGFISANGLSSFSGFGVGGGGTTGLPVELVSLKADPIDNKFIRVSWTTATEINNAGFEVLRSEDGINFTNIGWVDGAGNSSTILNYNLDDNDVFANKIYYYRLRQVDYDGQSDLTNIVSAIITDNTVFVVSEFMPNPTEGTSSFTVLTSTNRDINLVVYNTLGQIISDSRLIAEGNKTNKFEINLSEMAAGTYYAVITTGEHTFNKKIVVSR
jgi:hypothetical protein